jgi:hypothetical protein
MCRFITNLNTYERFKIIYCVDLQVYYKRFDIFYINISTESIYNQQ